MALMDHTYVIPANQEEVGVPNIHLLDHTYVQQLPVVQIQAQQEENGEEAQAQDEEAQAQDEEVEEAPAQDEEEEEAPAQNEYEEEAAPRDI